MGKRYAQGSSSIYPERSSKASQPYVRDGSRYLHACPKQHWPEPNKAYDRHEAREPVRPVSYCRQRIPMEKSKIPDADVFLTEVDAATERLSKYAAFITKLRDRLARAKKALAEKPAVSSVASSLLADLRELPSEPDRFDVLQLIRSLDQHLQKLRQRFTESFPADLRQACQSAHLEFTALPEGFGVGPFRLTVNATKETARFEYAKALVGSDLPLSATAITEQASALKIALLDQKTDLSVFAGHVQEAMRVVLARQNRPTKTELRADLPLVFHEMVLIRQFSSTRRTTSGEYPLARFVIELKQLVQSDDNMRASKPFRLEPAVIENTKNPKKSIFIPKDLNRGYGEGTYYQAVVLRQE